MPKKKADGALQPEQETGDVLNGMEQELDEQTKLETPEEGDAPAEPAGPDGPAGDASGVDEFADGEHLGDADCSIGAPEGDGQAQSPLTQYFTQEGDWPPVDGGWPPDEEEGFSSGDFSSPLDVERRLEEELAALQAQEEPEEASAESGGEESVPKAKKRKPATRRKKADAEAPSPEEAQADVPAGDDTAGGGLSEHATDDGNPLEEASPGDGPSEAEGIAASPQRGSSNGRTDKAAARAPRARGGSDFYQMNANRLDRDLTEEERQEWNEIYASFRSQSILNGTVVGVDQNEMPVRGENGKTEMRIINSLVIISYRVKVLIPESAVWMRGEERAAFLLRGMVGATVDYVVTHVDREGEVALGSRTLALVKRRRAFLSGRGGRPGDIVSCSVLVSGPYRCLVTCGGYDVPMRAPDMSYASILDMRRVYRPGQMLKARVMEHKPAERKLLLSVKEAAPNPFDGAERRHPVGSRRQAVITGKYKGGVYCTMADKTMCMCLYSNAHQDSDFLPGDNVIVHISQYDYARKHIYGRIVSKW